MVNLWLMMVDDGESITAWWFEPPEKYESMGMMNFSIYGKIKNVPNHQAVIYKLILVMILIYQEYVKNVTIYCCRHLNNCYIRPYNHNHLRESYSDTSF